MNRFEKLFGGRSEARVRFKSGEFEVLSPGDFVRCAVSGREIALAELKYWNVERQEAYAGAEEALERYLELRGQRRP
jgi:hypothetical protein